LFSSGYHVVLPWQTFPTTDRARVAVRLTTTDGRAFEADRDVTVHPVVRAVPRVNPFPATPVYPQPAPGIPPVLPPPGREPLLPGNPPPGVPPALPPGVEELPPPAGAPDRGARL